MVTVASAPGYMEWEVVGVPLMGAVEQEPCPIQAELEHSAGRTLLKANKHDSTAKLNSSKKRPKLRTTQLFHPCTILQQ